MKKEQQRSANKGFESLMGVHTQALEENSKEVVEILEVLAQRSLSHSQKSDLKKVKNELKSIDKKLDKLGTEEFEEDYEF